MKKKILIVIAIILLLALLIGIMYTIDMKKMENNMPVVFSTWGYDYAPPEKNEIDANDISAEEYSDFELVVVEDLKNMKPNKILNNKELNENNEDYNLYYYGLSEVNVKVNNKTISLEKALKSGKITLEGIIEKAHEDLPAIQISGNTYSDGGSREYKYGTYTIIKKHTLEGNRDIWIVPSSITLRNISYYN